MKFFRALFLIPLITSGCFSSSPPASEALTVGKVGIEVYLSRAALDKVEFEQYRLVGNKLFYECGELKRGRSAPKEQNVSAPSETSQVVLSNLIDSTVKLETKEQLDAPGNNSDLMDPGKAFFTLDSNGTKREFKTSLDAIEEGSTETAEQLLDIVLYLRGAAKGALCGNIEFYGIGMRG